MPNTNGLTALKEIMKINPNAKVVVMCSALGTKNNVIKAIKVGARDFVVKPNFGGLIETLEKLD
jgi:two-component system, chemotaxis family, chemotaxis protein CheY